MASTNDLIKLLGKGLTSNKDFVYLLDINLGGTLGTYTCANLGRDVGGNYYKSKIQSTGVTHRSIQPDNGQFETSDLTMSLSNGDLEYSKYPWNKTILNKPALLRMGFTGNSGNTIIDYLADGAYLADGSIYAIGRSTISTGEPGDISAGLAFVLYKGIIKKEERSNKVFNISIGDYTNKIFRDIPPRMITVAEFPRVGTSVMVLGTKTDADTSLVGKRIPYIWGDFRYSPLIKPLFIDTLHNRYLIADHPIGTVSKVFSGGTQVYNFISHTAGTSASEVGTHLMSYIDFGTSQGTKNVYMCITGRTESIRAIPGTMYQSDEKLIHINHFPFNTGPAQPIVGLRQYSQSSSPYFSIGTVGAGTYVTVGCYIKRGSSLSSNTNAYVGLSFLYDSVGDRYGTVVSKGVWEWVTITGKSVYNRPFMSKVEVHTLTTGTSYAAPGYPGTDFKYLRAVIGTYLAPASLTTGTGLEYNGNFQNWSQGTNGGTVGPDTWVAFWSSSFNSSGVPTITSGVPLSFNESYNTYYGTMIENPSLMLRNVLLSDKICGLKETDLNTESFDTTQGWLKDFKYRYIMDGNLHSNSIDFIQDFSVCTLASFHFDKNNMAVYNTYRPASSRAYIKKIDQTSILEDSFSLTRSIGDVYNKVLVNYDYDWIKKEYRNAYECGGTTYIDQFDTVKTFTIDNPFSYSNLEASFAGQKWLNKLQAGLNKVNFSIPISNLPIDVDDRVLITHEEAVSPGGGWADHLVNIYECEVDNHGKSINLSAIDEDEVNVYKRYFILGPGYGATTYITATDAQRKYGCLCSAAGLMGNSDDPYRLW